MNDQATMEEISAFVMPKVAAGQAVRYYQFGKRDGRKPDIAFIIRPAARTVVLRTSSGMPLESVRHIDDPKLTLNSDQRENGAWDYTEEFYENRKYKELLEERLSRIETSLTKLVTASIRDENQKSSRGRKPKDDA